MYASDKQSIRVGGPEYEFMGNASLLEAGFS